MLKTTSFKIILVGCLLSFGVSTQAQKNSVDSDEKAKVVTISIKDFKYNGNNSVTVRVGDSVVWYNQDDMPHSATAREFDTGILKPGERSEPILLLEKTAPAGISYTCVIHDGMKGILVVVSREVGVPDAVPTHVHETQSTHSMVVTGSSSEKLYLHHIALFSDFNHYYHVTLVAKLTDPRAQKIYQEFRQNNGDILCVIDPEPFLLTDIKTGKKASFKATFFRGKWEQELQGLQNVDISVTRIIQFRRFDPDGKYPEKLTYQLYGDKDNVFLAHQVTEAPNFQEVVKLKDVPSFLTQELIESSPLITIPTKRIASSGKQTFKTAVLSDSSHILLSPPTRTLSPTEPLKEDEEVFILLPGESTLRKVVIGKTIYFDVRILNK